jgi:hypothetical protein
MIPHVTFRPVAAFALAFGLFLALPGCGSKPQADNKGDKKDEKKDNPNPGGPNVDPKVDPKTDPAKPPQKVDLESGVGKEAAAFLKALGEGTAKADKLSAGFVKMVGVPVVLPSDKAKGYSADAAEGWLRRVSGGANFGLPSGFAGADAAVLWGSFQGPSRAGGYFLRMVNEAGAWKVDYLALSSASYATVNIAGGGPDAEYQRFAANAVAGVICDKSGMPNDDRAAALAAGLTPALRAHWAEPFGSDKDQGYDYNRGKLLLKAGELGGGAESYSTAQQGGDPTFRLEVTKAGGAKSAYTVKLAKGPAPGQWLVESVTPQ